MSGGMPLIVLEIFLGFGVPLAWAIWELVALRRYREQDRARPSSADDDARDIDSAAADDAISAPPR
jgi:hypothetical protein